MRIGIWTRHKNRTAAAKRRCNTHTQLRAHQLSGVTATGVGGRVDIRHVCGLTIPSVDKVRESIRQSHTGAGGACEVGEGEVHLACGDRRVASMQLGIPERATKDRGTARA